jgi:hypothetical protein
MKFENGVREITVQADVNETPGSRSVAPDLPGEEHFAAAADAPGALNNKIPFSVAIVVESITSLLTPSDHIAVLIVAGEPNPGLEVFGTG